MGGNGGEGKDGKQVWKRTPSGQKALIQVITTKVSERRAGKTLRWVSLDYKSCPFFVFFFFFTILFPLRSLPLLSFLEETKKEACHTHTLFLCVGGKINPNQHWRNGGRKKNKKKNRYMEKRIRSRTPLLDLSTSAEFPPKKDRPTFQTDFSSQQQDISRFGVLNHIINIL